VSSLQCFLETSANLNLQQPIMSHLMFLSHPDKGDVVPFWELMFSLLDYNADGVIHCSQNLSLHHLYFTSQGLRAAAQDVL